MKNKFSLKWKASKQPRKQRKYSANAPLHLTHKMKLSCHLSKELRLKYKRRAVPVRKNDVVKIMRGFFKGKQGKVADVKTQKGIVYIEGMQKGRKDGTSASVPFIPSNLIILNLNVDDKRRVSAIEKKGEARKGDDRASHLSGERKGGAK